MIGHRRCKVGKAEKAGEMHGPTDCSSCFLCRKLHRHCSTAPSFLQPASVSCCSIRLFLVLNRRKIKWEYDEGPTLIVALCHPIYHPSLSLFPTTGSHPLLLQTDFSSPCTESNRSCQNVLYLLQILYSSHTWELRPGSTQHSSSNRLPFWWQCGRALRRPIS